MSETCPFCDVDANRVLFSDDLVFATWDAFPVSDGHLLIVTHRHISSWFAASEAEQRAVLTAIGKGRQTIVIGHLKTGHRWALHNRQVNGRSVELLRC